MGTHQERNGDTQDRPTCAWSVRTRIFVSVLLIFQLLAVLIGPWSTPPNSRMARDFHRLFHPYVESIYMNNGYQFFAPNPGPSHLLRCELTYADGKQEELLIPDRNRHWPRLLYHRHFMLSEKIQSGPEEWRQSYADHLLKQHGADKVVIHLRRHFLARMGEIRNGLDPQDASFYEEEVLVKKTAEELRKQQEQTP